MVEPLATLLADDKTRHHQPLATGPQGLLTWGQFFQKVAQRERDLTQLRSPAVAVMHPDPCEFLATLWATWRLGKTAVVSTSGFRDQQSALGEPCYDRACATEFNCDALPAHLPDDTALVLYTSGSSGAPQPAPKSLIQLDAEIAALDSLWGESLTGSLVVNLVSHHHMFGLPFGLLWPMARGTLLYTRTVYYPEPLEELVRRHCLTLVCSPVHLQHLPDKLDSAAMRGRVSRIFSAGSPLDVRVAHRCEALFGKPVTEIYGSTETGAIAWRQQPEDPWQCLPGVTVDHAPLTDAQSNARSSDLFSAQAGAMRPLRVCSPTLPKGCAQMMADLAEIHAPTRFVLGRRVDRIAKVGGKRVSLTALENALLTHPWVEQARVLLLVERKGRLGAVVVLNSEGKSALIDQGRTALGALLKAHLAGPLEPVTLPRYWRYVARMPLNSQGKSSSDVLRDLFIEERQSRFPNLLACEQITPDDHCRLTLHIPDNLYYFNGHFPGNPVLPGVVQTHWAIHYACQHLKLERTFAGLEAVKFQHIIQPGAIVTLDLQWMPEREKLHFSFTSPTVRHSSGRVTFLSGTDS